MASITIRNLDETLKHQLRIRAARHGRSMEEEARELLRAVLAESSQPPQDLASAIRGRFAAIGGIELELPMRESMREPPDFLT
jgi:plasmid stability protein